VTCLLDTQAILWITKDDPRLSNAAAQLFLDSQNKMLLSMASLWEMSIKINLQKLSLGDPLRDFIYKHIRRNDVTILDIDVPHILLLENLPMHHRDPFDRMIIAQAMHENVPIISSDPAFDLYPIRRIW